MRATDAPLRERLDRLYDCFRQLRRTRLWTATVEAAIAVVEVTRGRNGTHWHAHLHVVWRGAFIPHEKLKAEWHRITQDSYIVDVASRGNAREMARYVAKYVAKATDITQWSGAALLEYALAIRGRRLLMTTGAWHGSGIGSTPKTDNPGAVVQLATIGDLVGLHTSGMTLATEALALLASCGPWYQRLIPIRSNLPPPTGPEEADRRKAAALDLVKQVVLQLRTAETDAAMRALTANTAAASPARPSAPGRRG